MYGGNDYGDWIVVLGGWDVCWRLARCTRWGLARDARWGLARGVCGDWLVVLAGDWLAMLARYWLVVFVEIGSRCSLAFSVELQQSDISPTATNRSVLQRSECEAYYSEANAKRTYSEANAKRTYSEANAKRTTAKRMRSVPIAKRMRSVLQRSEAKRTKHIPLPAPPSFLPDVSSLL